MVECEQVAPDLTSQTEAAGHGAVSLRQADAVSLLASERADAQGHVMSAVMVPEDRRRRWLNCEDSEDFSVRTTAGAVGQLRAVEGVDLAIGAVPPVGLVGESGSGKSTIARLALRLTDPTSGRVHLDGRTSRMCRVGALVLCARTCNWSSRTRTHRSTR